MIIKIVKAPSNNKKYYNTAGVTLREFWDDITLYIFGIPVFTYKKFKEEKWI